MFVTYSNLNEYLNPKKPDVEDEYQAVDGKKEEEFYKETNVIEENVDVMEVERKNEAHAVETIVNSNIISASINERKDRIPLMEPVVFTLEHKQVSMEVVPTTK